MRPDFFLLEFGCQKIYPW